MDPGLGPRARAQGPGQGPAPNPGAIHLSKCAAPDNAQLLAVYDVIVLLGWQMGILPENFIEDSGQSEGVS